jgi:predicted amidohydrolase YtcJ
MNIQTYSQTYKKAFINGIIYTVNERLPTAESVVIAGNKIIFVGNTKEAKSYIDEQTYVIDLNGKLMLPGFIDNHVHFISGGFQKLGINLRKAKTIKEFKDIVKEYALLNKGNWITGGDWDHESWEKKELPEKEWIDIYTPKTPVFVSRLDGHMGLANSYALELANITKDTPNPAGGVIVKDPRTGEPTGILKDNAMSLIYKIIPLPSEKEYEKALNTALEEAKENGFTSVQDITEKDHLKIYQKYERENKLSCRIYTRLPIYEYDKLISLGIQYGYGSDKLKIGSLKAYVDGSLGSSTALFFEPYKQDPLNKGLGVDIVTNGELKKWSIDSDKNRLQLSIHAIGDSANSIVLDIFEEILRRNPNWDRRLRIEHAQHVKPNDIQRFAQLGVIASVQPYHLIDDGCWAETRIGKERLKDMYVFRSFLNSGVKICFGSDWNVAPLNALLGIYAAVTRRTLDDKNPDGWIPEQKISVEDAIKCYTINNAYASFEENIKGSIEVGKLADFVVLNENIITIDPLKIKNVKVDMTVFNGEIIFSSTKTQ